MTNIYDQSGDLTGQILWRLGQTVEIPDYVKEAGFGEVHNTDELPESAFADPVTRQFQMHTKAAAWLSRAYFEWHRESIPAEKIPGIERRLSKTAEWFGIEADTRRLSGNLKKQADAVQPLGDDDFGLVRVIDGETKRWYPMRNTLEVVKAAEYFDKFRTQFAWEERNDFACRILEKAAAFGADISPFLRTLQKSAGMGGCLPEEAAQMIWDRVHLIAPLSDGTELQQNMAKMAMMCLENPAALRCETTLKKLAQTIDTADRLTGVNYSEGLEMPEDVLFHWTEKSAEEELSRHFETVTGRVYEKKAFARFSLEKVRTHFGDEFADEVSDGGLLLNVEKLAAVVPTLPRPDAEEFDRMAADSRIQPVERIKTGGWSIDPEELASWASRS